MSTTSTEPVRPGRASLLYDPRIRGYVYQLALLAIVGFPFLAGFFSKDAILYLAMERSTPIFAALAFTAAAFTAA